MSMIYERRGKEYWDVYLDGEYAGTITAGTAHVALKKARKSLGPGGKLKVQVAPGSYTQPLHRPNPSRKGGKKRKPSATKRISAALTRYLKKQNPAMKRATQVRVQRLKGGAIKFTPVL